MALIVCKRQRLVRNLLLPVSIIVICVIVIEYWLVNPPTEYDAVNADLQYKRGESVGKMCILLYNNAIGHLKKGKDIFDYSPCNMSSTCRVSTVNSDLQNSKVVIFHHTTMPVTPPSKKDYQWWIFTSSESPPGTVATYKYPKWQGKFDWIMNYRRDAHFFFGYGDIMKRREAIEKDYDKIYRDKVRDVAWIVSHCETQSKREIYIKEMQKYINIDIFGNCGNRTACKSYTGYEDDNCHDMVGKKYKFYLSFENVMCKSYTTEKLYFAYAFDKNVIPVVRGAFDSKDYIPSDAAIFAEDFHSPKELALFLKDLGSNKKKYIEYLRNKDKYGAKTSPQTLDDTFCSICQRLETLEETQRKPLDVQSWMFKDACRKPQDLIIN